MDKAAIRTLWDYNAWANEKILAAAAGLPEGALRHEVASGHGSLFGTLLHIVDTEYGWRMLCEAGVETPLLTEGDIPDLAAMAARVRAEAEAMRAYIDTLSDADLALPMRYGSAEQPRARVRWQVLFHVINHGSYHRGEAAAALTALGRSPGELDFTEFLPSSS